MRLLTAILVKGGVAGVEVLAVEAVLGRVEGLGKALVVDDLALAEEFQGVTDVGIVDHAEQVVVGHAGLLLGGEVLAGRGITELETYFNDEIKKINAKNAPYKAIGRVKLRAEEFPKNTSRKITRFKIDKSVD